MEGASAGDADLAQPSRTTTRTSTTPTGHHRLAVAPPAGCVLRTTTATSTECSEVAPVLLVGLSAQGRHSTCPAHLSADLARLSLGATRLSVEPARLLAGPARLLVRLPMGSARLTEEALGPVAESLTTTGTRISCGHRRPGHQTLPQAEGLTNKL